MSYFSSNRLADTPPVVKNLIYINAIMLLATWAFKQRFGIDLDNILGLHYITSPYFHYWQFITHMFMHGGFFHIFFNMFALWMFGRVLENVWGSKRFLFYYMVTGVGAALFLTLVNFLEYSSLERTINAFINTPSPDVYANILRKHFDFALNDNIGFINSWVSDAGNHSMAGQAILNLRQYYSMLLNIPTIGASGAVFGVLLGFGMLFPNTELMLIFPPIPIKAKWVVIGYGAIELYYGITQPGSDIAHFAHLGGMLFGFILIKYWNTRRNTFY